MILFKVTNERIKKEVTNEQLKKKNKRSYEWSFFKKMLRMKG